MTTLHVDFETRSAADLKKTGVYAYAADPTTDIWCMAYAFGDEPVRVWTPGEEPPAELVEHVMLGGVLVAHNAAFERVIWRYVLAPRYGFPEPDVSQWRCTMVMAYALGLPGSLENAAPAAGIDIGKDMAGRRLMLQMARPRKVEGDKITWWDDSDKLQRLIAYCKNDVEVERALEKRLRPLSESELKLWHLDQVVNDRGVLVDEALATAAKKIVKQAQASLDARMRELTGYAVSKCSNRNELVAWVRSQGVKCESIGKEAIEEILEETVDLPPKVRQVLEVRRESAKASVAKIDALLNGKSPEDGRAKGLIQFHAASTGRWGGRRFQPQNIKKPEHGSLIPLLIDLILAGESEMLDMLGIPWLTAVADTLRGMLVVEKGRRLMAADYNAIEARVLAWLAGQDDLVRLFNSGGKVYETMASRIYGVPVEQIVKTDPRRQLGKTAVLGCGYGMGAPKFQATCAKDGIEIDIDMAKTVVDVYRQSNDRIKQFWYDMENAAVAAVKNRGSVQRVGKIAFKVAGSFLFMRLPSGRFLSYPYPEVRAFDTPWGEPKEGLTYFSTIDVSKKAKIVEDPNNSSSWARIKTYGGMLAENATQAVARDVLADAMPRLEAAGYPIILTVHDEIVCEAPDGHGSVEEMEAIMCDLPAWASGLPVAAEGFEGARYRK